MLSRHATLAALVTAALAVGACGGDEDDSGSDQAASTQAKTTQTTAVSSTPQDIAADIPKSTKQRPELPKPGGTPPTELETLDIVKGKGKTVKKGDQVTVDYVGANWSNGMEFDASWNRGEPFPFEVGGGQVIPGWDQGVAGMKVGGRRLLIIPPDLGYGPQGQPPSIPGNETLMFVVDARKVK
jgi:peptidylprolyl isomerase